VSTNLADDASDFQSLEEENDDAKDKDSDPENGEDDVDSPSTESKLTPLD
jgi:hypothetical protein